VSSVEGSFFTNAIIDGKSVEEGMIAAVLSVVGLK